MDVEAVIAAARAEVTAARSALLGKLFVERGAPLMVRPYAPRAAARMSF
jgi:hypothetical protein